MLNRKGQNVAEYSILIALVIGAAVAMQVYVRRGLQGRVKEAVDHTGENFTIANTTLGFTGSQYEPYYQESNATVASARNVNENIAEEGNITRTSVSEETRRLSGSYETTRNVSDAY